MPNAAIKFLREQEWTVGGNRQCPKCYGVSDKIYGEANHECANSIGHSKDCQLAAALIDLGEQPLMQGNFHPLDGSLYKESEILKGMKAVGIGDWGKGEPIFDDLAKR